jgi:catalase
VPAPTNQGGYEFSQVPVSGPKVRARGPKFFDFYNQARLFYNSLVDWEKIHLLKAATFELGKCDSVEVRQRMVDVLANVDMNLATKVAMGIGVRPPTEPKDAARHNMKSPAVSQDNTVKSTIQSRRVAFLVCPGYKGAQLTAVSTALAAAGAVNFIIGPVKGDIPSDGSGITRTAQFSFFTSKSVMFDAVVVVGGKDSVDAMGEIGEAMAFVNEAFKHCKPIAAIDEGKLITISISSLFCLLIHFFVCRG